MDHRDAEKSHRAVKVPAKVGSSLLAQFPARGRFSGFLQGGFQGFTQYAGMGMVAVAALAAVTAGLLPTITETLRLTSSAARFGSSSGRLSA